MTRQDIQIIIHSNKDNLGRQSFTAEWIADNIGPTLADTGIRGQCFFTDLDKWIENKKRDGRNVVVVPENQSKCGYVLKNDYWIKYDVHTWMPIK